MNKILAVQTSWTRITTGSSNFKEPWIHTHKLHSEGVGRHVKHAETISVDEENQLWDRGVLNTTTPRGLQNAVFYVIGKMFCLRGGQEHRALKLS